MQELVISRVAKPKLTDQQKMAGIRALGDEIDWAWAFPLPYRVLNTPNIGLPMPKAPSKNSEFFDYLSYWATLQHLLTYSLGWSRHDVGLKWWMDAGCPTNDLRFALLDQVWHKDDNLWKYLVWAESNPSHSPQVDWLPRVDTERNLDAPVDEILLEREILDSGFSAANSPFGMHLESGGHLDYGFFPEYSASIYKKPDSIGEAVYVADRVEGWYFGLNQLAEKLGSSNRTSWHVDVYVKEYGYMGVYRKSTVTGRWFTGPHSLHMVGNPKPESGWVVAKQNNETPKLGDTIEIAVALSEEQRRTRAREEFTKLFQVLLKSTDYWTFEMDRPDAPTPPYIQGIQEATGWTTEVGSNAYIDPPLSADQLTQLTFLGYGQPEPPELPNFWIFDEDAEVASERMARVVMDVFNFELEESIRLKTSDDNVNEYLQNHFLVEFNKLRAL